MKAIQIACFKASDIFDFPASNFALIEEKKNEKEKGKKKFVVENRVRC